MKVEYHPTTPKQRLGYLIEELGEALAAAGKTIRWGPESVNPELSRGDRRYGETNRQWLRRELVDAERAIALVRQDLEDGVST